MTKKEILVKWIGEPRVRYCSKSPIVLGYGDGIDWVKDMLRPALTKNATFLNALEFCLREVREFLKSNKEKKKVTKEAFTLYEQGYNDGVSDAMMTLEGRLMRCN